MSCANQKLGKNNQTLPFEVSRNNQQKIECVFRSLMNDDFTDVKGNRKTFKSSAPGKNSLSDQFMCREALDPVLGIVIPTSGQTVIGGAFAKFSP